MIFVRPPRLILRNTSIHRSAFNRFFKKIALSVPTKLLRAHTMPQEIKRMLSGYYYKKKYSLIFFYKKS